MSDAAFRLRSQLVASGAATAILYYVPPVERREMPEADAIAAVEREPTRFTFDPPPEGVKVIDVARPLPEEREQLDGQDAPENEADTATRIVFYLGPVERCELAAIDALHALEAHSDDWRLEAPTGVEILDKVPVPLEIKPELLCDPKPHASAQRGPDGSFPIGAPSERPDFR
jgi:hypothetical protein